MKITAFNSSPKANRGNTNVMVEEFLVGASQTGAKVEQIYLANKRIKPCLGCLNCKFVHPGKCAIKDDMGELIRKYLNSNIVILATPIYIDDMNGIMKNFIDRLFVLADSKIQKTADGYKRKNRHKTPNIVMISSCGFPGQRPFQVLKLYCKRIAYTWNSKVLTQIYCSAAQYLVNTPVEVAKNVNEYKKNLKKAGLEIVKNHKISKSTIQKLNKSIVPAEYFLKQYNEMIKNIFGQ